MAPQGDKGKGKEADFFSGHSMGRKSTVKRDEKVHPQDPTLCEYFLTVNPKHDRHWPTRERDVLPKVFSMLAQLLSGTSSSHITITKYQRQSSRFLVHFQLRDDREGRIAYRLPKMVLNRGLKDKYEFLGYGAVPAKRLPDAPPANAKPAAEEEEEEEEGMEEKEAEAEEEAEDGAAAEVDD